MADPTLTGDPTAVEDDGVAHRRLASRVLAWQRRNPLARRVTEGEVTGLGVIALPYGEGAGAAAAPLFHQPALLPGLSHRQLIEFASRHAVAKRPGAASWPQRDVERADAAPEPAPQTRYLLTAALPGRRGQPSRLLLAPAGNAIWGRRPLGPLRVGAAAVAAAVALGLLGLGVAGVLTGRAHTAKAVPAAPSPASAASGAPVQVPAAGASRPQAPAGVASPPATGGASGAASGVATPVARPAASMPAPSASAIGAAVAALGSAAAPPPPAALAASAPKAAASTAGARAPSLAPSAPAPAPSAVAAASAPAAAASLPAPRLLPMPSRAAMAASAAEQARTSAAAPSVATGPHYAIVSVPTRQRAAADATLQRVRQLLGPAIGDLQAQVMPSPQGFVVTLWPLPTQADAERLADVLARRGVPMKWMEF